MKNLRQIKKKILSARRIAIAGHVNPDGDCIGSLLAFGLGLNSTGKRAHMLLQDDIPKAYRNLPGANKIKKRMKETPDLAITVDCNTKEMVGAPFNAIKRAKDILEIDHHMYRKPFGTLSLIDGKAAAVGEIIYKLLKSLNIDITKNIARNILTSIIVETNSFRLPSVKPFTFRVCDRLLLTGVDYNRLSEMVYWLKTKEAAVLSGLCMANIHFLKNDKIAWSIATKKDFSRMGGRDEDVDSVANDMLSIETVKIAILFREKSPGLLRVSLRSKGGINVACLAYKYNGGGHFDSAGCLIANKTSSIQEFLKAAAGLLDKCSYTTEKKGE
ncbi:bifunctional oligoribonuclease/PAP phosphatase NrnA [bacterium]|jgi:phosphoesterase RecJ-like protein|nr:bifunctional oligoribonuclease/PAP phosphatase NrnA [bacterium]